MRLIDADALIKTLNEKNIPVDVRVNYEIMNAPTIEPDGDLISRQDVIELVKKSYYDLSDGEEDMWAMVHDVEQLPSAPDSRQHGEWVRLEREENVHDLHGVPTWGVNYMCDKCGFITTAIQDHFGQYRWCPSCGADMRKEESEEDHDYERAVDQMIHNILYEPTYNPEDGSM